MQPKRNTRTSTFSAVHSRMKFNIPFLFLVPLCGLIVLSCNKDKNPVSSTGGLTRNILFTADNHLCMIDAEGNNFRILESGPSGSFVNWQAHSSSDGGKVVFAFWAGTGPQQIYLIDLHTLSRANLTKDSVFHESPSFSPGGKSVIFLTSQGWMESIFTRDLQLRNLTQLTRGLFCYSPSYSKDGSHITFAINNTPDSQGVAIMESDGRNVKVLGPGWDPQLSPDGIKIMYTGFYSAYEEGLYIMNVDGSQNKFLTTIPWQTIPRFSPDGSKVVFSNFVNNNFDIFIMSRDSSGSLNLTNTSAAEFEPSFSPDGTKIIYVLSDTSASDKLMIMG